MRLIHHVGNVLVADLFFSFGVSIFLSLKYEQIECWLTAGIKNVQTLWQRSLQYLIMFNQNHAQHLPPTFHHSSSKQKLK